MDTATSKHHVRVNTCTYVYIKNMYVYALRSLPPFLDHKERTFCAWVKVPPV